MAVGYKAGLVPLTTSARVDIVRGFKNWHLWSRLGWLDVQRRYRRTVIGPFWSALSLATFIAIFSAVGASLSGVELDQYIPFLAAGMVVWMLVSSVIGESGTLYVAGAGIFRQARFDYSVLVYALVWRNFVVFLHNLLVYVFAVAIFARDLVDPMMLLALPGMLLLLINLTWVALLLGSFCLRFRDMQQLIASAVQIAMFVTPIFWSPKLLTGYKYLLFIQLNPLYHIIDIVRSPLLGHAPALESFEVAGLVAVVGWVITFLAFARFRRRLAYWS
jgi:ABC-type polysaccharide/polyol phosphate export permease